MFESWFEIHDGKSKIDPWLEKSLFAALKQQKLLPLYHQLIEILPDISNQYTNAEGMNCMDPQTEDYVPFYDHKVRAQHTFQMYFSQVCIQKWLKIYPKYASDLQMVDIGDSSGNHLVYLKSLLDKQNIQVTEALSVNLDQEAVEKIQKLGRKALLCRAEELYKHNIHANIFLSFEMLEHLTDPCRFLYQMSKSVSDEVMMIVTVPLLRKSRLGMHHIRLNITEYPAHPEDVHILELSVDDWKLLAQFSGWKVIHSMEYLQYPQGIFSSVWKKIWTKYEYEGFLGLALIPDSQWSNRYLGW